MPKSRLFSLAILIISIVVSISASRTIIDLWQRRTIVAVRRDQVERIGAENKALEDKLKDVQSVQYLERVARDKLGMVKDGEQIVIIPKPQTSNPNDQQKMEELPNWKKWWSLFF